MAKQKQEESIYSTLRAKSVKPMAVNIPKVSNLLSPSGSQLQNVNVRPSRMQTAKHDAAYIFNSTKDINSPKSTAGKVANAVGSGILAAGTAPVSLFNVISGQARYNKNKRAGFEKGAGDFSVKKINVPASTAVAKAVDTTPSRIDVAKKDALKIYNENKSIHNPESKVGKIANTLFSGVLAAGTAPISAVNVASGQATYNKNKKANEYKVRNSSMPLASTEFNED